MVWPRLERDDVSGLSPTSAPVLQARAASHGVCDFTTKPSKRHRTNQDRNMWASSTPQSQCHLEAASHYAKRLRNTPHSHRRASACLRKQERRYTNPGDACARELFWRTWMMTESWLQINTKIPPRSSALLKGTDLSLINIFVFCFFFLGPCSLDHEVVRLCWGIQELVITVWLMKLNMKYWLMLSLL